MQWIGPRFLTWIRGSTEPLEVIDLNDGSLVGELHQSELVHSVWLQVDVARVTWLALDRLDYFLIGALDHMGIVSIWDSDLQPLARFNGRVGFGYKLPLDLVLTQDYLGRAANLVGATAAGG